MTITVQYPTAAVAKRMFSKRCSIFHAGKKSGTAAFMNLTLVGSTVQVSSSYHNEHTMLSYMESGTL